MLGPRYVNFIDWSEDKYSFNFVQPIMKIVCEFKTGREYSIKDIKATNDGKRIIVAFSDGVVRLYRIYKDRNNEIYHENKDLMKKLINL